LALQRAGHGSPVRADLYHLAAEKTAEIEWHAQDQALLQALDANRVTEEGAEAIALAYVNAAAGWVVKRRLQRSESADWLLHAEARWLALEVSGVALGDPSDRLHDKKRQVSRCSLPAERLAVVVSFERPAILAESP
jgi:hypothetical protein